MKIEWASVLILLVAYQPACDPAPATIVTQPIADEGGGAAASFDADALAPDDASPDAGPSDDPPADADAASGPTADADAAAEPPADADGGPTLDAEGEADATDDPSADATLDAGPTSNDDSDPPDADVDAWTDADAAPDAPAALEGGGGADGSGDADAAEGGPTPVIPALPGDMTVFIDGSRPSTLSLAGFLAADTSLVDTSTTLVQPTTALEPTYDRYTCGAGPGLIFGGSGAPSFLRPSYMGMTNFTMAIPFSMVVLARADGAATLAEISIDIGTYNGVSISSATGPTLEIRGPGGVQTADATSGPAWNTDDTARALILTYDGTAGGAVLTANGVAVPLTFGGVASGTGAFSTTGVLGADHAGGNPLTGSEAFFGIVSGRVVSDAEAANILAYLGQYWVLPPPDPPTRNTIAIGDSLVVGYLTQPAGAAAYGFYERAVHILGPRFGAPHNLGVAGSRLTTGGAFSILSQWTTGGPGALVPGMPNVVVVEGGINDVATANPPSAAAATAAGFATVADMQTVVAQVASDMAALPGGPHTIEVQTITLPAVTGLQQMARRVANNVIRANYAGWGNANVRVRLVDVGADPALSEGTLDNLAPYYNDSDSTHPMKPGQERWGALLAQDMLAAGL